MCLKKSFQDNLVEYITNVESEIEQLDPADEESGMSKDQGTCFKIKCTIAGLYRFFSDTLEVFLE